MMYTNQAKQILPLRKGQGCGPGQQVGTCEHHLQPVKEQLPSLSPCVLSVHVHVQTTSAPTPTKVPVPARISRPHLTPAACSSPSHSFPAHHFSPLNQPNLYPCSHNQRGRPSSRATLKKHPSQACVCAQTAPPRHVAPRQHPGGWQSLNTTPHACREPGSVRQKKLGGYL